MDRQFEFNFGDQEEKKKTSDTQAEPIRIYSFDELVADYKKKVGVDPTHRMLNRGEIISGIQDPEAEKARLAEEDRESDKENLASPYTGKK